MLLFSYSPHFRREARGEMMEVFRDQHRYARAQDGISGVMRLWLRTGLDLLTSAVPERLAALRSAFRTSPPRHQPTRTGKGVMMETLLQDVRYAVRTMVRYPGFTAVVTLTLALGIGANTAIFTLINQVLLRPLPIADPDEVVALYTSDFSSGIYGSSSYPDYVDFREQSDAFADLAAFRQPAQLDLASVGIAEQINGALVTGNYFSVLGVTATLGRVFTPSDDVTPGAHPVAVLSYGLWQRRFGGERSIVGQTVNLNGVPYAVVGVAPEAFTGTSLGSTPDIWLPLKMVGQTNPAFQQFPVFEMRGGRWLGVVGRLAPGATIEQAQTEVTAIMQRLAAEYPQTNLGTLSQPDEPRPMTVLPASEAAVGGGLMARTVGRARLLMAIVGLVLLIACANVANLLLARAQRRRQEVAIRIAIGAARGRLIRQMLTESAILSLLGGSVGLALAYWIGQLLVPLGLPSAISRFVTVSELTMDGRIFGFTLAVSLLTGLFFGAIPALHASRPSLVPTLHNTDEGIAATGRRYGVRDVLVVLQVASSLILLIGAGLFVRSLQAAYGTELGFNADNVILTTLNVGRQGMSQEQGEQFYRQLLERTSTLPGVQATSLAAFYPVQSGGRRRGAAVEGYQPDDGEDMELNYNVVGPGFFRTLQMPLLTGRRFAERDDASAPRVVIVNETFVERYWPGENPLGKRINLPGPGAPEQWYEVIGVVPDGKYRSVREGPIPYMYLALPQAYQQAVTLAVRTAGDPTVILPSIRSEVRSLSATMPLVGVRTLSQHLGRALAQERTTATMIGTLGLLALLVAAVGIYGVMSYTVSQRTQEIGIRAALGAGTGDVLRLVVGHGMRLAVVGVVIGVGGGFALSRLVESFLFGVSATDPPTFVGVAALLAVVALLASYIPAHRATKVDPMLALRYE
jgi:predicted permease